MLRRSNLQKVDDLLSVSEVVNRAFKNQCPQGLYERNNGKEHGHYNLALRVQSLEFKALLFWAPTSLFVAGLCVAVAPESNFGFRRFRVLGFRV